MKQNLRSRLEKLEPVTSPAGGPIFRHGYLTPLPVASVWERGRYRWGFVGAWRGVGVAGGCRLPFGVLACLRALAGFAAPRFRSPRLLSTAAFSFLAFRRLDRRTAIPAWVAPRSSLTGCAAFLSPFIAFSASQILTAAIRRVANFLIVTIPGRLL